MKKDIISKKIIKKLLIEISKYFLNLNIENKEIEFLDKELKRIEKREADIVANINNEFILHLEIQNSFDALMPYRMLRYYTDISFVLQSLKKELPIKQYLIYIGEKEVNFSLNIKKDLINYSYNFVDIRKIDCELLLNENKPEALVLAILCDFKEKSPQDVIGFIIDKLKAYTKENLNEFRNYMLMLETLSSNRKLKNIVKEQEMLREIEWEKLPSFQIGIEKGIEKGILIGEKRGEIKGKILILKEFGFKNEEIAKKVGISIKEVENILGEYNANSHK